MKNGGNLLNKMWDLARSKKAALTLIVILALAVIMEAVITANPGNIFPPSLKPGAVYGSLWFQLLSALFLLNLTVCTADRLIRRSRNGNGGLCGRGSSIFHAGLILVLAGSMITANYRMVGRVGIIQGGTKYESHKDYSSVQEARFFKGKSHLGFGLTLLEQDTEFDDNGMTGEVYSVIRITEENRTVDEPRLALRQHYNYRNVYLYCSQAGYAVKLTITSPGTKKQNVVVPLKTENWQDGVSSYTLSQYSIKGVPYDFAFRLYPDLYKKKSGGYINRSFRLNHPGVVITAREGNKTVPPMTALTGQTVKVGGYSMTFDGVTPWTSIVIVRDPGAYVVFAGIVAAAAGLCMVLLKGKPETAGEERSFSLRAVLGLDR